MDLESTAERLMVEVMDAQRDGGDRQFADLLELRRLLVGEAVALACLRRSPDDLAEIDFAVWELSEVVALRSPAKTRRCERALLRTLVRAGGNPLFTALFATLERLREGVLDNASEAGDWENPGPSIPVEVYRRVSRYLERHAAEPAKQLLQEALLQSHRAIRGRLRNRPPVVAEAVR